MILVWCSSAFAVDGDLDTTFNVTGKVTTAVGSGMNAGNSVAIQSDGKIVVAGSSNNGTDNDFAVVRYNSDGSLDTTFGSGGQVITDSGFDDNAQSVAIQSDGKIVVVGYSNNGTNYDFAVVRYKSDGNLDATFGSGGKVTTDFGGFDDSGQSVAIQSDGKIVVAGSSNNSTSNDFAVVRYNSDGSLDTTFGSGGEVTTDFGGLDDFGQFVAIQSDGKIVVSGQSVVSSAYDVAMVRYNSDGSLDTTFGSGGKVTTNLGHNYEYGKSVVIQSDGKIVVAVESTDGYVFIVVRYKSDGNLDPTFGSGGIVTTVISYVIYYFTHSVAIQLDGKIVVAGYSYSATGISFAVERYNSDGSLDTTFGTGGKITTALGNVGSLSEGLSIAIQLDGKIVVAGSSSDTPNSAFAVARYLVNTAPVATADTYSTNAGTALNIAVPGVLSNDTDADNNPLTAVLVSTVSHGTLTLNANGSFAYTPTANWNGTDSFTYYANDGTVNSAAPATVTITVNAVPVVINSAPVSSPSSQTDLTPYQYTGLGIRVTVDGTGQGRVVSTTAGLDQAIDCSIANPTGCLARFVPAAEVTLVATPAEGSTFAGWGGDVDCLTGHFLVTGGKLCTAYFHLIEETLTVAIQGQGSVTATTLQCPGTCTANYPYGTTVTLQAQPATGWEWQAWTGDCDSQGQVQLTGAKRCVATFVERSHYNLTVTVTGRGTVSGPTLKCPDPCTASYLAGTTVTLTAQPVNKLKWFFQGWSGGCNSQGQVTLTQDTVCQAVFTPDQKIPNTGDGNGDGLPDIDQENVVSLPDKVSGTYLTVETQPATCVISDIYPDLAEAQTIKLDHTKKFPQGMLYFDIACPQAQVSVYYHGMSKLYRNLKFYKFGPKIPGDLTTIAWYQLPNIQYEVVMVGGKPVVKGTYTLTDGELGDSTGVDGHIVDPGGMVLP